MAKIELEVNEQNLGTLVTILTNLKDGLIENMDVNSSSKVKSTRYQPKVKKVIYEEEQGDLEKSGKYLNPAEFKKRLK